LGASGEPQISGALGCASDAFVADLVVEDPGIVELRSVRRVAKAHEAPLVNY
jgi:hypothetical protein